ncbi:hypothetical protein Tco_1264403 [Tanacetum coccineum]
MSRDCVELESERWGSSKTVALGTLSSVIHGAKRSPRPGVIPSDYEGDKREGKVWPDIICNVLPEYQDRVPLLPFNNSLSVDWLSDMAISFSCEFGVDANLELQGMQKGNRGSVASRFVAIRDCAVRSVRSALSSSRTLVNCFSRNMSLMISAVQTLDDTLKLECAHLRDFSSFERYVSKRL